MTLIPDGTSSRLNLYVFSIFNHNRIPDCHAIAAYDFDISIAAAGDVSSAVNRIRTISFSAHIFNRDTPGTVHSQVCCDISAYHIACSGIFHQDVTGAGNSSFAINESAGRCTRYFHILCAGNGQAAIYHSTVRIAQYHIHLILEIVSDLDLHLAKAAGTGQGVGIRVIGELVVSDSKNVPAVFAGHFNGGVTAYRDFDAVVGCLISDLLPFSGQGRVFVHSNSDIFAGLAASLPASEFPPRDIIRRFGNDIHLSAFGNRINTSFVLVCFHRMVFVGISLGIRQGKGVLDSGIFRRSSLDVQILCIHRCRVSRIRQRSLSIAAFTFTNCHTVSTCGICAGEHDLAHSAAVILHGQGLRGNTDRAVCYRAGCIGFDRNVFYAGVSSATHRQVIVERRIAYRPIFIDDVYITFTILDSDAVRHSGCIFAVQLHAILCAIDSNTASVCECTLALVAKSHFAGTSNICTSDYKLSCSIFRDHGDIMRRIHFKRKIDGIIIRCDLYIAVAGKLCNSGNAV